MSGRQRQHQVNVYTGLLGTGGVSDEQIGDLLRHGDLTAGQAEALRAQHRHSSRVDDGVDGDEM